MGNAPSTSGQDSSPSHVPGDDSKVANIIREPRPEHLRIPDTDSEEEVDDRQSIEMEVPHLQFSYTVVLLTQYSMQYDVHLFDRYISALHNSSCWRCVSRDNEVKVISMSLYGAALRYTVGAIRNAQLLPVIFPGWRLWFYCERPGASKTTR